MKTKNIPLRKTMCATCPFRYNSPYKFLADELIKSAITEGSRICHSTGSNNAINKRTGKPQHLCRGARDIQLKVMCALKIIEFETDEAWDAARIKRGYQPTIVKDP